LITKKRFYILLVSRDTDGTIKKVPVPLHYAYVFAGVAIIGLFTITGLAGSYSRMLIKTARFNQLRQDHATLHTSKSRRTRRISRPPRWGRWPRRSPRCTA
jgi:hypothetical protein